jgi:hypothetical protein
MFISVLQTEARGTSATWRSGGVRWLRSYFRRSRKSISIVEISSNCALLRPEVSNPEYTSFCVLMPLRV